MSLLGERLRQAREAHGISTYQAEIDTRIRATVIESLEQGNYDDLPPAPFLRGLIRTYSNYLGSDADEMLSLYAADLTPPPPPPALREPFFKPAPRAQPEQAPPPSAPSALPVKQESDPTRKKISPPPLMPKPSEPPERLPPPETLEPKSTAETGRISLAHFTRRPAPLPIFILIGVVIFLMCLAVGLFVSVQVATLIANTQPTATATRLSPTRTPTLEPGALPTKVPTLAATAPPFPTFPGNATATVRVTPLRTLDATTGLNFDVEVTQTISIQVGIDGVMVYNGQMTEGTSRSWSARDVLYVRIENPKGAILSLNGNTKYFGARIFAETKIIERQWSLNDKGALVSETPVPPPAQVSPTTTPTVGIPIVPLAPTPTLTPFS